MAARPSSSPNRPSMLRSFGLWLKRRASSQPTDFLIAIFTLVLMVVGIQQCQIQREQMKSNRAFVYAETSLVRNNFESAPKSTPFSLVFTYKNIGETYARDFWFDEAIVDAPNVPGVDSKYVGSHYFTTDAKEPLGSLPGVTLVSKGTHYKKGLIVPQASETYPVDIWTAIIDNGLTGKSQLYAVSWAKYKDIYGDSHETMSCSRIFLFPLKEGEADFERQLVPCENYNCVDEDCKNYSKSDS